jgi:hypothetical protein
MKHFVNIFVLVLLSILMIVLGYAIFLSDDIRPNPMGLLYFPLLLLFGFWINKLANDY